MMTDFIAHPINSKPKNEPVRIRANGQMIPGKNNYKITIFGL